VDRPTFRREGAGPYARRLESCRRSTTKSWKLVHLLAAAWVAGAAGRPLPDLTVHDDLRSMAELLNQARCAQGLAPVAAHPALGAAAAAHSVDMALHGLFGHHGSDGATVRRRVLAQGYPWQAVGENVGAGAVSAQEAFQLWWESAGHRRTMLDPAFREVGLGHVYGADTEDGHYWTLVLASRAGAPKTACPGGRSPRPDVRPGSRSPSIAPD
jgi:uncharacterized protein YkwD